MGDRGRSEEVEEGEEGREGENEWEREGVEEGEGRKEKMSGGEREGVKGKGREGRRRDIEARYVQHFAYTTILGLVH